MHSQCPTGHCSCTQPVDGKQVKDSIQIPVDEFKTIEVLKGEEAIEKYGEKARNGVIIIIKKDK